MFTIQRNFGMFGVVGAWAFSVLLYSGCYETYSEDPLGTLTVPFEIAYNGAGCDAAGVETVLGVLDDGAYQIETSCSEYITVFENIPEGLHSLSLYGIDANGIIVVDNLENGPTAVEVVAFTQTTVSAPLVLKETPVLLGARWDLDWGSCASRGIAYFRATVYAPDGTVILETLISCDTPGTGGGEYRIMPDPKRDLVDPIVGSIKVEALKNKVKIVSDAHQVTFDDISVPGPGETIGLSFKCLESGCYTDSGSCPI